MSRMNPKVDFYFNKAEKWQEEFKKLRKSLRWEIAWLSDSKWVEDRRSPRRAHRGVEPMPHCCCCPNSGAGSAGRDQLCTQIRQGSSGGASAG